MRVLFIEPCYVGFGGYFRAYNISLALSNKNISVDLLCSSNKKYAFNIKRTRINKYLHIYELPRFYLNFFINGRVLRGLIAAIFGIVGSYDIIHAAVPVQLESNIPAVILKLLGKRIVMDWDDYWEGSPIYGEFKIMKRFVSFCERNAPHFFKNIVVVSDFLEKLAKKRGAEKVLKLINGVNTNQFLTHGKLESIKRLHLNASYKYLLTFGNTYTNDRAYLLFKTFENIWKHDHTIKLLFNFDPYEVIKEQKLGNKINMECVRNIINVGYIKQDDLGYYLGASNAVIFLMNNTDNERACFPIRIGSYLNGEAIIIINDVNSEASNTLKHFNCVIMDKSLEQLAFKVTATLSNEIKMRELRSNVLKAKKILSWNAYIDRLIAFYNSI